MDENAPSPATDIIKLDTTEEEHEKSPVSTIPSFLLNRGTDIQGTTVPISTIDQSNIGQHSITTANKSQGNSEDQMDSPIKATSSESYNTVSAKTTITDVVQQQRAPSPISSTSLGPIQPGSHQHPTRLAQFTASTTKGRDFNRWLHRVEQGPLPFQQELPHSRESTEKPTVPGTYHFDGEKFTRIDPPYGPSSDYVTVTKGDNTPPLSSESSSDSSEEENEDTGRKGVNTIHIHLHLDVKDLLRKKSKPRHTRDRRKHTTGTRFHLAPSAVIATGKRHGEPGSIHPESHDEKPPVPIRTYKRNPKYLAIKEANKFKTEDQLSDKKPSEGALDDVDGSNYDDDDNDDDDDGDDDDDDDVKDEDRDYLQPISTVSQPNTAEAKEDKSSDLQEITGKDGRSAKQGSRWSAYDPSYEELDYSVYEQFDKDSQIKAEVDYFYKNNIIWFHPRKQDGEAFVKRTGREGYFAIVPADDITRTPEQPFILIMVYKTEIRHFPISRSMKTKKYKVCGSLRKSTVRALVDYYQDHKLPSLKMKLFKFPKRSKSASSFP